jgi:hypothetical protein
MTPSRPIVRSRARLARRASFAILGVLLGATFFGAWMLWPFSRVEGQESCVRCGSLSDVEGRWPFRDHSEPRASSPSLTGSCAAHAWVRVGCWQEGATFVRYAGVARD